MNDLLQERASGAAATEEVSRRLRADRVKILSLAVGLLYFTAAVAALVHAKDTLRAPDELEYLSIGRNLAQHGLFSMDGTTPTAWRSPGLPTLIALVWLLAPSVYAIKIVILGCWMTTGWVIARLATFLHSAAAGLLAAVLYLCYGPELYAATTLYPQTIAGLLVVIATSIVVRVDKLTLVHKAALIGATVYAIMLIPNCIALAVVLFVYGLLRRKIGVRTAITAGLATLLVVGAWCYRNETVLGGFAFVTSAGLTTYEGNHPGVTADTSGPVTDAGLDSQTSGLSEVEVNTFYKTRATDWMRAHPHDVFKLAIDKFLFWFAYTNSYATPIAVPSVLLVSLGTALIYYPVLIGALMGMASRARQLRDFAVLSWMIYLAASLTYVLFLTRIRYRLPFDPLLFAAASGVFLDLARSGRWFGRNNLGQRSSNDWQTALQGPPSYTERRSIQHAPHRSPETV